MRKEELRHRRMDKHTTTFLALMACFLLSDFGHANKVDEGIRAVHQLLKYAMYRYSFAYGEKIYFKKGGYRQALKDFQSVVDPNSVRNVHVGFGKEGTVGDKTIRLREAKGHVQMPTLSISNTIYHGSPEAIIKYIRASTDKK